MRLQALSVFFCYSGCQTKQEDDLLYINWTDRQLFFFYFDENLFFCMLNTFYRYLCEKL